MGYNDWFHKANQAVAESFVGKRFRLEGSGHRAERKGSRFFTEIRAGLATFFAMAYIISVNSSITSQSGGTCICARTLEDPTCDADTDYLLCVQDVQRDLVTATAAIAALTSFCMGLFANMPIALAPGMGLNAYFTFTVVGRHGTGPVPYRLALTAVFVEGFIFAALSLLGMRQWLARVIPASLKLATGVGIGLYLALIGLTYDSGIGVTTGSLSTPLELAGCLPSLRDESTGACLGGDKMRNPTTWLGIFIGGIFIAILMMYRVKGALIYGILLTSIISWPRNTPVTYFPYTATGDSAFNFFKQVVTFHPIERVLNVLEYDLGGAPGAFGLALVTFLYVDIFDCTGTLYSMARFSGAIDPRTQDFEGSAVAYLVDAFGISIGSLFGSPPVTAYIESGAGIQEGGKTGLTAMTTGICFFIAIFFAPIFASIPPWATGGTLILIGAMMMKSVVEINWSYPGDAIPAFVCLMIMPLTYSIAYGLIAGIVTYMLINGIPWAIEKLSGGRIRPHGKEDSESWTWKVEGGLLPLWVQRAVRGKRDFWRPDPVLGGVEQGEEDKNVDRESTSNTSTSNVAATTTTTTTTDLEGVVAGRTKEEERLAEK